MSEAAEQLDESNALKKECALLRSAVDRPESDEAGSLQRLLGLVRMNHALESQVAHVHGRMRDEYNLAMDELDIKSNRLSEVETVAHDFNSENRMMRAENSEMSPSLRKAIEATNEYQFMISSGTELRAKLNHENERLRETMRQEESTMQAKFRGAGMYHNQIVTNKDGQIETLRDQIQHLSGSESREEWFRSAEKARTQLSDVESRTKLEVDRLRDHLNREEMAASNLKNELSEARQESHSVPV